MKISSSRYDEDWAQIPEFPNYSVSSWGRIRREDHDRIIALSRNQQGNIMAAFLKDGKQYRRSVATIVADNFLGDEKREPFTTPTHQDGDKTNNYVGNLFWRPRWFTVRYQQQFENGFPPRIPRRILNHNTGVISENSAEASIQNVVLERDIFRCALIDSIPIFPDWHMFSIYTKPDI